MTTTTTLIPAGTASSFRMTPQVIEQERSLAARLVNLHRDTLDESILRDLTSDNPANVHIGLQAIKPWLLLRKQEREQAALEAALAPLLPIATKRYKSLNNRKRYQRDAVKRAKIIQFLERFNGSFSSAEELRRWIKEAEDKLAAIEPYRPGGKPRTNFMDRKPLTGDVDWKKGEAKKGDLKAPNPMGVGAPQRGKVVPIKRNGDGTKKR